MAAATFEVDGELMRGIEDTTKSLDSNVALKDKKAAGGEARELAALFVQVESYYSAKANAADAVGWARKTHQLAASVQQSVEAEDYDAAADTVSQLVRSCKTCHEVYKNR